MLTALLENIHNYNHSLASLTKFFPDGSFRAPMKDNLTLLQIAAREGDNQVVLDLIEAGAEVDATSEENHPDSSKTPLYLAIERGHLGIARILYYCGANLRLVRDFAELENDISVQSTATRPASLYSREYFWPLYLWSVMSKRTKVFEHFTRFFANLPFKEREELNAPRLRLFALAIAMDQKAMADILIESTKKDPDLFKASLYDGNPRGTVSSLLYWALLKDNTRCLEYFLSLPILNADWLQALYLLESSNRAMFRKAIDLLLAHTRSETDILTMYVKHKEEKQKPNSAHSQMGIQSPNLSVTPTFLATGSTSSSSSSSMSSIPSQVEKSQSFPLDELIAQNQLDSLDTKKISAEEWFYILNKAWQDKDYIVLANCFGEIVPHQQLAPLLVMAIEQKKIDLSHFLLVQQPLYIYTQYILHTKPNLWKHFFQLLAEWSDENGILFSLIRRKDKKSLKQLFAIWINSPIEKMPPDLFRDTDFKEEQQKKLAINILRSIADDYPGMREIRAILRTGKMPHGSEQRRNQIGRLIIDRHVQLKIRPSFEGKVSYTTSAWISPQLQDIFRSGLLQSFLSVADQKSMRLVHSQWKNWIMIDKQRAKEERLKSELKNDLKKAEECIQKIQKAVRIKRYRNIPIYSLGIVAFTTIFILGLGGFIKSATQDTKVQCFQNTDPLEPPHCYQDTDLFTLFRGILGILCTWTGGPAAVWLIFLAFQRHPGFCRTRYCWDVAGTFHLKDFPRYIRDEVLLLAQRHHGAVTQNSPLSEVMIFLQTLSLNLSSNIQALSNPHRIANRAHSSSTLWESFSASNSFDLDSNRSLETKSSSTSKSSSSNSSGSSDQISITIHSEASFSSSSTSLSTSSASSERSTSDYLGASLANPCHEKSTNDDRLMETQIPLPDKSAINLQDSNSLSTSLLSFSSSSSSSEAAQFLGLQSLFTPRMKNQPTNPEGKDLKREKERQQLTQ